MEHQFNTVFHLSEKYFLRDAFISFLNDAWTVNALTSCAGIFSQNWNILSVLSTLEYITQAVKQTINSLLFSNFYPAISCRRVQKGKRRELSCTIWSLVMVRSQLPARVVKGGGKKKIYILGLERATGKRDTHKHTHTCVHTHTHGEHARFAFTRRWPGARWFADLLWLRRPRCSLPWPTWIARLGPPFLPFLPFHAFSPLIFHQRCLVHLLPRWDDCLLTVAVLKVSEALRNPWIVTDQRSWPVIYCSCRMDLTLRHRGWLVSLSFELPNLTKRWISYPSTFSLSESLTLTFIELETMIVGQLQF